MVNKEPRPGYAFIRLRYPHMGKIESALWTDFLRKTKLRFIDIKYDIRVGIPIIPRRYLETYAYLKSKEKLTPHEYRELKILEATIECFTALTKLRIDAVGETENEIWIFEVKPRAGRSALGQLLSYGEWYRKQFNPMKPIKLAVVCYNVDPSMKYIFDRFGIHVFIPSKM